VVEFVTGIFKVIVLLSMDKERDESGRAVNESKLTEA